MNSKATLIKFDSLRGKFAIGNLTRSFSFTDEPKFFHYSCSVDGEKEGSSSCDENKDISKIKALGEYVERYCLDNPELSLFEEKYDKENHIDPRIFMNFRDEDMGGRKSEYLDKIVNSDLLWVDAINRQGEKIRVPAQLVYINYPFKEPIIRPRISTGAAAHEDISQAITSGIMENIERDSYMLTFYPKRKTPKISLEGELQELDDYFKRYKLDLNIYETTTDLGIPSFMCLNIDRTGIGPAVSVGLSAGLDPKKAIRRSIIESQQLRQWIRYKYVEEGSPSINSARDIKEIHHRGYYWHNQDKLQELDFLLNNPEIKKIEDIVVPAIDNQEGLIEDLERNGIDTYVVDINHKIIKDAGFEVVKVLQPQLHPMFLEQNLPTLDSDRMRKYANGNKLNSSPHPFM